MDIYFEVYMHTDWHTNEEERPSLGAAANEMNGENEIVNIESVNESNDVNQINKNFA